MSWILLKHSQSQNAHEKCSWNESENEDVKDGKTDFGTTIRLDKENFSIERKWI